MLEQLVRISATAVVLTVSSFPVLAQREAPKQPGLALAGYCPVAYVAMNQAVKGDPQHKSEYQGLTYHLTNADAKRMFDAAPGKYAPAYGGLCATAVAQGMKLDSDPRLFAVHNGRAYLFSNAAAKAMFEKDRGSIIAKADANWPKLQQQK